MPGSRILVALSLLLAAPALAQASEDCVIGAPGACGAGRMCVADWRGQCPERGRCEALPESPPELDLHLPVPAGDRLHCAKGNLRGGDDSHSSCNPATRFGFDLASPASTPPHLVVAPAAGVAHAFGGCPSADLNSSREWEVCNGGFGNIVRVQHGPDHYSQVAHLSAILVHTGQEVEVGTPIGIEGNSGNAGPKHLHVSLHRGDARVPATGPSLPIQRLVVEGAVLDAANIVCGDWSWNAEPDRATLLVSRTPLARGPDRFGFSPRLSAASSWRVPAWHSPVMWSLLAAGGLVLLGGALVHRTRASATELAGPYLSPLAARAALSFALAVLAVDLGLFGPLVAASPWLLDGVRAILVAACVAVSGALAGWRWSAIGLAAPVQGWWYWARLSSLLGVLGLAGMVGYLLLVPGASGRVHLRDPLLHLYMIGLSAPVLEEAIYRLAVCTPAAALAGRWPTIASSGLLFAALHFVYGNPDPSNMLGGFLLAWAYLHSRSIIIPIALHALGNLGLLAVHLLAAWL